MTWTSETWLEFLAVYQPVFDSSAWLAKQAGIDPEHFRDGLQEIAQAVCRGWQRVPTRKSLIVCALRAARRLRDRGRRRVPWPEEEPVAPAADEEREVRRTLVHELAHGHPDDPLIAAILAAPSQREAARLLGVPYSTFQGRLEALRTRVVAGSSPRFDGI